jgi:hypothetical protein
VRNESALLEPFAPRNDCQEDNGLPTRRVPVPASVEVGSGFLAPETWFYGLKSQNGIQELAGQRVKVIGILDATMNTIDNAGIEAAPVAAPRYLLAEFLLTAPCGACVWFVGSITHLNVGAEVEGLIYPALRAAKALLFGSTAFC